MDHYTWLADYFAFVLGGERLFAKHYFAGRLSGDEGYFADVLRPADEGLSPDEFRDYQRTEAHVGPFLDQCMSAVDWGGAAIVGFATTFQQTMPSLCLARRIKAAHPNVTIVFGGAACEGAMGIELARQFPEIDYVFLGEADLTFPAVVEQILAGGPVTLPPSVVGRRKDDAVPASGDRPPSAALHCADAAAAPHDELLLVRNLDELPYPDFDDYFARWESSPLRAEVEPLLFYETSRGCWWGEKHHCKFCGLNGASLAFRSKGPARAVEELAYLVGRHGVRRACSADNIFDYRYFDTFLPMLKAADLGLAFVYEMKTNLTRRQVAALLDAGLGAAQLGIETFITSVLRLVGKGANAVQNLQTLKWFSEAGIEVKWNVLYGFPGEEPAEYQKLADLIPSLVHLAPPLAAGRARMDRFSPYFEDPASHGMVNPRANRAFRYVYPFPPDVLDRLAYYYEFDFADGRDPLDYARPVVAAIEHWQSLKGSVTLRMWDRPDGVLILTDTRPGAAAFQHRLVGLERALYLYCDEGRSLNKLREFAARESPGRVPDEAALGRLLDGWIQERLMAHLDERYLSLALQPPVAADRRAREEKGTSLISENRRS